MTDSEQEEIIVESLEEVTDEQCNKWFYCSNCETEFRDEYAEIRDGKLVGACVCGWSGWKSLRTAFKGKTRQEKRREENQTLTRYKA